ncbi:unnamed protein product, partial [Closterium sp. NIES-53]
GFYHAVAKFIIIILVAAPFFALLDNVQVNAPVSMGNAPVSMGNAPVSMGNAPVDHPSPPCIPSFPRVHFMPPFPLSPVPCSLFPFPCSLFPVPCSLFPVRCSLFPVPCSLSSVPCSLSPVPCPLLRLLSPVPCPFAPPTIPVCLLSLIILLPTARSSVASLLSSCAPVLILGHQELLSLEWRLWLTNLLLSRYF